MPESYNRSEREQAGQGGQTAASAGPPGVAKSGQPVALAARQRDDTVKPGTALGLFSRCTQLNDP
jgi:hypothetical protein